MDIRRLRYFAAVSELGSFTKAAAFLRVAQPALSRQVQQLEAELGQQLLVRAGRQVQLTDAGKALLRHVKSIERDFERLIEDMTGRREKPSGRVVFGVPPALADVVVPPVAKRVKAEYPLISMTVQEGLTPVLADWVETNELDLAIISLMPLRRSGGLRFEPLTEEDMAIFECASARNVPAVYSLAELEIKPVILGELFATIARWELGAPDLSFNAVLRIEAVQATKALVLQGEAAALLPVSMLQHELRAGLVTASRLTARGVRRHLTLAQPSFRQMTQAAEAVTLIIKEEVNRKAAEGMFTLDRPLVGATVQNGGRHRTNGRGRGSRLRQGTTQASVASVGATPSGDISAGATAATVPLP